MSKEAAEVLRKARELISDPKRWTQGEYAKDANGLKVGPNSARAVCFCSLGAIAKVKKASAGKAVKSKPAHILYLKMRLADPFSPYIWDFNDKHTHAEVLEAFDKAIAAAEAA